jgi:hypothetical protein
LTEARGHKVEAAIVNTQGSGFLAQFCREPWEPYQQKETTMEILIIWAIFAGFTSYIASQKNRSALAWLFWGILFGIFAMVAVIAIPAREKQSVAG